MVLSACPKALASVAHPLWVRKSSVRKITSDLGSVVVWKDDEDREPEPDPLGAVEYLAKSMGAEVIPRLPLTPAFYRKGWYSFEVGKALDAWVERRAFRAYAERPGWLEE
jgi:hypothetical protein